MSGEFLKIRTNQIIWRKPSEKIKKMSWKTLEKDIYVARRIYTTNKRVWSWLRINAGGAHKTCKSNGSRFNGDEDLSDLKLKQWL